MLGSIKIEGASITDMLTHSKYIQEANKTIEKKTIEVNL